MSMADNQYDPYWRNKTRTTKTWGAVANSSTITDSAIGGSSYVLAYPYGSTPAAGRWVTAVVAGGGSAVVTSSDAENSALTYHYIIL